MSEDPHENAEETESTPDAPVDGPDDGDVVDAEVTDTAADAGDESGVVDAEMTDDDAVAPDDASAGDGEPADPGSDRGGRTAPAAAARPVVRRKIVSKRVTPKGGGPARSTGPATRASVEAARKRAKGKADPDDLLVMHDEPSFADRRQAAAQLPSPWWVPALMFGLLIVGALIIMLNYMGTFGDPSNVRLIIGLVFILGGIITATQYR